jgi:hypothetical protein
MVLPILLLLLYGSFYNIATHDKRRTSTAWLLYVVVAPLDGARDTIDVVSLTPMINNFTKETYVNCVSRNVINGFIIGITKVVGFNPPTVLSILVTVGPIFLAPCKDFFHPIKAATR